MTEQTGSDQPLDPSNPDTTSLEQLMDLMQERKNILEGIDRLGRMDAVDSSGYKCESISFMGRHGLPSFTVHSKLDSELSHKLVQTARQYFTQRISTINLLVGLADRAVLKVLEGLSATPENE